MTSEEPKPDLTNDNNDNNNRNIQEDTTSSASVVVVANKPARRRRLAHRRQYTKSRRIASSFLRSQFVRYDDGEDDDGGRQLAHLPMDNYGSETTIQVNDKISCAAGGGSSSRHHTNIDNWFRVQTLPDYDSPTTNVIRNARTLASGTSSAGNPLAAATSLANCHGPPTSPSMRLQHQHQQSKSHFSLAHWAAATSTKDSTLSGDDSGSGVGGESWPHHRPSLIQTSHYHHHHHHHMGGPMSNMMVNKSVPTSLELGSVTSSYPPGCDLFAVSQQQQQHQDANGREMSFANYSSSSLESYSYLNDNNSTISKSRERLRSPLAANNNSNSGSITTARSISFLSSLGDNNNNNNTRQQVALGGGNESKLKSRAQLVERPCHQHGQNNQQMSSERVVVRSETIDLNRVRWPSSSSASTEQRGAKFFPPPSDNRHDHHGPQLERTKELSRSSTNAGKVPANSTELLNISLHNSTPDHQASTSASASMMMRFHKDSAHCIDNVHFNDLFHGSVNDSSSVTINQSVRTDPRLYKDDVDIKFSRALNSCKLPQIRYASKERLFERLTDLRFLSIDFLNTFLLTYRVFTTAEDVLEALKSVHYNCERYYQQQQQQQQQHHQQHHHQSQLATQSLARDSLSVFPNSSLNSISTNTNNTSTLISDQAIEEICPTNTKSSERTSTSTSKSNQLIDSDRLSSQKLEDKQGQVGLQLQHQKPPSIPPRSCSSSSCAMGPQDLGFSSSKLSQQQLDQHHQPATSNKYLMAPNANQAQKRRSTISALTPITGSNSSSLVNLTGYNRAAGGIEQHMLMMAAPCSSGANPYESSCATSATSSLGRNSDLDDLLALRLSVDDGSDLLSPPVLVGDRFRSSSMTRALINPTRPLTNDDDQRSLGVKLDVPTCRQVRASSLSHVGMPTRSAAAAATTVTGNYDGHHTSAATGSTEHWRLSYKKAAAEKNRGDAGGLLSGRLAAPAGPQTASTRRASSSDITFHVTFEPPPAPPSPMQPQQPVVEAYDGMSPDAEDVDVGTIELQQQDKLLSVLPHSPIVPPSTPVEPVSPMPEEEEEEGGGEDKLNSTSGRAHKKGRHRSSVAGGNKRPSRTSKQLSCNGGQRGATKLQRSSSCSSDSSSVVASESTSSSLSYADTKSVLSSQSESGLIQSTSSSSDIRSVDSESDEASGLHETRSRRHYRLSNGRPSSSSSSSRVKHHRSAKYHREGKLAEQLAVDMSAISIKPDSDGVSRKHSKKRKAKRQLTEKSVIKGIDLTEAKMFDCDTSADEDKVSTSSGTDDSDDQQQQQPHEIVDTTAKFANEDDKSFLILTRLNSVRLDDDDDEDDDSREQQVEPNEVGCSKLDKAEPLDGESPTVLATIDMQQVSDAADALDWQVKSKSGSEKDVCDRAIEASGDNKVAAAAAAEALSHEDSATHHANSKTEMDGGPPKANSSVQSQLAEQSPSRQAAQTPDLSTPITGGSQRSQISSGQTVVSGPNSSIVSPSSRMTTPRSSFQQQQQHTNGSCDRISKAGVIVSSSTPRVSSRRSSTASAASAFAAATAASNNPILTQPPPFMKQHQQPGCNRMQPGSEQQTQRIGAFAGGDLAPIDCLCSNFHRASVSSSHGQLNRSSMVMLHQPRPSDVQGHRSTLNNQQLNQQQQLLHYPSCIYYQQQQQLAAGSPSNTPSNSYPNPHSDASSMCNSRASSRLSSCAGLEYSSYSSVAPVNLYSSTSSQQQQQFNQTMARGIGMNQQQQQQQQPARSAAGQGTMIEQQQQQSLASQMIQASRYHQQANNQRSSSASKRNSTQINNRSVATLRVLSVLRHWVSKHSQDFVNDTRLSYLVQEFLQDLIMDNSLLPAEHKAALQLQQMVQKAAHSRGAQVDLDLLLAAPSKPSPDSIETLSALEIAEGMTYLDHKIFLAIRSEEFLGQAWMKMDKAIKAPHILLITKRFNDVSRLVSSEIIRVPELHRRVAIIEKWTNVAHICRVVHNFNGVLQICAAFTNSAIFRLKKTWDKIPKTTKTTIDQLQNLVSTDSRFRNMRDAINRCDPPSIPYVGMYLTDLSFIEEGTPNYSSDSLLNFSKMRMIAHVIREIQHLQNGTYKIELNHRVANYLLDGSRHLQDDEMYRCSLAIEPRSSGGKNGTAQLLNNPTNQYNGTPANQTTGNQQQSQQSQQQSISQASGTPVKSSRAQ